MGYRGVIRSLAAASNAASRDATRRQKAAERAQTRLQKKINTIYERKEKVCNALKELYAKGKIVEEEYQALKTREDEVEFDLLVFGKTAGVELGKRYVCGKIDKTEFEQIKSSLLPSAYLQEKESYKGAALQAEEKVKEFEQACAPQKDKETCQKCCKQSGWFRTIYQYEDLSLCGSCKSELVRIKSIPKFNGVYVEAGAFSLGDGALNLKIKDEHF